MKLKRSNARKLAKLKSAHMSSRSASIFLIAACSLLLSCGDRGKPAEAVSSSAVASAPAQLPPSNGASAGLQKLDAAPQYNIEAMGKITSPLLIKDLTLPSVVSLDVLGWAVDPVNKTTGASVDVVIDGNPYATTYNIERVDVSAALKNPRYKDSGFATSFGVGKIPPGKHRVAVRVVTKDHKSFLESPSTEFTVQ
jgi:hypothetical protein